MIRSGTLFDGSKGFILFSKEHKKSEPFSYRKKVRILLLWCSTRNTNPCFQPARRMQAIRLLDSWSDLCEKYHCTKAQLVIALTARMIPGLHVLCGARTPEQAIDNAGALHIALEGADAVQMKWDVDAIS